MKLVFAWLSALAIAVLSATSCTINHRSSDYACTQTSDCENGRACLDGFCVTTGAPIDAPRDVGPIPDAPRDAMPDAPFCPPQCTSCRQETKECVIDCASTSCNQEIVCPTGWNCTVQCTTANSCRAGIDCTDALSCKVTCSGNGSCRGLQSGTGPTTVVCSGNGACRDMDCSDSCACDMTCGNNTDCSGNICPAGCGLGLGRCSSSVNPFCDQCM